MLLYLLIDFGVLGPLLGISNGRMQPFRAAAEAGIATTLFGFLFIYLNLHRWHLRFIHLALALAVVFLALFGFAFFQPEIAATVARLVLALLGVSGFFLILLLALRGYDRAVLLVPTWIIYIAWLFYGWLVISGQVSNDVAQPAVAGGLVLIVMLLGFTAVQHAFSEGQVSIGTLSEVERRALALTGSGDFVFDWNIERDRVSRLRRARAPASANAAAPCAAPSSAGSTASTPRTATASAPPSTRWSNCAAARSRPTSASPAHDGSYRTFRMRVKPVLGGDGQVNRIVGTLQDVNEDRASRDRLLHDAVHDSLTGLPNKQLFLDRLERALVRARLPNGIKPAVFLIDIDRFMDLEERVGHSAADSVLLAISRRIARVMRPLDTRRAHLRRPVRGDPRVRSGGRQDRRDRRADPQGPEGARSISATATSRSPPRSASPSTTATRPPPHDVLRDAELAMYYAKRLGGDRIEAYRASARSIAAYTRASEEDLDRGLRHGELAGAVPADHGHPLRPDRRRRSADALEPSAAAASVKPEEFIPLAERTGLIERLGRLAFEQAAGQTREWLDQLPLARGLLRLGQPLAEPARDRNAAQRHARAGQPSTSRSPAHLKLEITESQVMTNPEHSAYMLQALKQLGLGLALDDFGTGHSSLSYLHRFPFDTIKIPAPFVQMARRQRHVPHPGPDHPRRSSRSPPSSTSR